MYHWNTCSIYFRTKWCYIYSWQICPNLSYFVVVFQFNCLWNHGATMMKLYNHHFLFADSSQGTNYTLSHVSITTWYTATGICHQMAGLPVNSILASKDFFFLTIQKLKIGNLTFPFYQLTTVPEILSQA